MDKKRPILPKIKDGLVFREEEDGAFIFDPIKDELRCLNKTGSLIFNDLNGKNSIDDIVKKMRTIYPYIARDAIKEDIETFIENLGTRGILED